MKHSKVLWPFLLLMILVSCKDPYTPPVLSVNNAYLVVEGNINGNGTTAIKLSRTLKIYDTVKVKMEPNALVSVESSGGATYPLYENGNGIYAVSGLGLSTDQQYRLRVKTADNKEYVSDFVQYKQAPPIDSVSWKIANGGVQIYANTHDPQNTSRYYKWDYNETWEIRSPYPSSYKYSNGQVDYVINPTTNTCWKYGQSTNILLGSSAKLQEDVIKESPVLLIPYNNEKISVRYSMLLTQYVIDEKGYAYFNLMKKNTESLGSIFDPQPSELKGNIHCITNPDETVVGYVTASGITQQRLFIKNEEIPNWIYRMNCDTYLVPNNPDSLKTFYPNIYLPYEAKYGMVGGIIGYYSAFPECVDCTLRGGDNNKPSYW